MMMEHGAVDDVIVYAPAQSIKEIVCTLRFDRMVGPDAADMTVVVHGLTGEQSTSRVRLGVGQRLILPLSITYANMDEKASVDSTPKRM